MKAYYDLSLFVEEIDSIVNKKFVNKNGVNMTAGDFLLQSRIYSEYLEYLKKKQWIQATDEIRKRNDQYAGLKDLAQEIYTVYSETLMIRPWPKGLKLLCPGGLPWKE